VYEVALEQLESGARCVHEYLYDFAVELTCVCLVSQAFRRRTVK
jgi:hypothetical protein